MTCDLDKKYIYIFKGDDTNFNDEQLLTVNVTSESVDLSTMTAKFTLGSYTATFPLTSSSFVINLTHAVTGAYACGPINGVIQILDSEGRIKTVSNTIPFYITNKVTVEQPGSIDVPVPEGSPAYISITIGGGGSGKAEWGFITGTLSDQEDLQAALEAKQNALTTQQQSAVNSGIDSTKVGQIATNASDISTINGKIPAQASSENQLADKNFVNSSIATNTANFIGTFNSVADLEAYSGTLTNNDYAFVVGVDSDGNTVYNRYKYNGETQTWIFEYALNNSSFTAAQWAAINSGITDTAVTQIGTNATNIGTLQTDKQPKTLATPITVEGTSQTTVEGALRAINTLAGKELPYATSSTVGGVRISIDANNVVTIYTGD